MMRDWKLRGIAHYADTTIDGGGIQLTFASWDDYDEAPRHLAGTMAYADAFDLLDALVEELGQELVSTEAYVFTPDWSEPRDRSKSKGIVVNLEDYRATEGTTDCDGRCINCECGYYNAPAEPPRLADRWQGDGFGPHRGNDVY